MEREPTSLLIEITHRASETEETGFHRDPCKGRQTKTTAMRSKAERSTEHAEGLTQEHPFLGNFMFPDPLRAVSQSPVYQFPTQFHWAH